MGRRRALLNNGRVSTIFHNQDTQKPFDESVYNKASFSTVTIGNNFLRIFTMGT